MASSGEPLGAPSNAGESQPTLTHSVPRVVLAAAASGQGKTSIATGLMGALRNGGDEIAGFKVGPDYIDPGYHLLATGRPGRNLDSFMCGAQRVVPLLLHGFVVPRPADMAVIEGVMGLYDGRLGTDGDASTAHIARLTNSPVIVVVDIRHASRTMGAVVRGLAEFDPRVHVAGVILNQAASVRHADECARAVEQQGFAVVGVVAQDDTIAVPSRHLGLVPAAERPDGAQTLNQLVARMTADLDLDAIRSIAAAAPDLNGKPWDPAAEIAAAQLGDAAQQGDSAQRRSATECGDAAQQGGAAALHHAAPQGDVVPRDTDGKPYPHRSRPVVAVAGGRAFTFRYPETTELLEAAGCETVVFDPLTDDALPKGTCGIYLGGGFPEVHAAELAANTALTHDIAHRLSEGVPTVAECAGMLYLARSVPPFDGSPAAGAPINRSDTSVTTATDTMSPPPSHPMLGVLNADAAVGRLRLGYRTAQAPSDTLLAKAGETVVGHEFHRTRLEPAATAAWILTTDSGTHPDGASVDTFGGAAPNVHASYLHTHWAGAPQLAARFAAAIHRFARQGDILDHHGDSDCAEGLVDFAVNVQAPRPPQWLGDRVAFSINSAGCYPDVTAARRAIAAHHGVAENRVLPTSGGAEAFTLIARVCHAARRAVVVHPQFTEPESALWAAGVRPGRHVLSGPDFTVDPASLLGQYRDADVVFVGNPCNPTGVLTDWDTVCELAAPGRTVVVDEAFMDLVPGEAQTAIGRDWPAGELIVVRSLTKTWSLAGIRAGYVVASPRMIDRLARQQSRWSVSSPAAVAMVETASDRADQLRAEITADVAARRADLIDRLAACGLDVVGRAAPFVLTRAPLPDLPQRLRAVGFAVRRADTFPGLGPQWVRLAVRTPADHAALVNALEPILGGR